MSAFVELFDLVGELARRRYQAGERRFAELGLNHTEARLLTLLRRGGGESAQDALSNQLTVDRTNAGRALQRLELGGYIERRKTDNDRRAYYVRMTAKGKRTAARIAKMRAEIAATFFGELSANEAQAAVRFLSKAL